MSEPFEVGGRGASHRPHPETERPLDAALQGFDLWEEVSRLRSEEAYGRGQRNAITLHKGEGMSVVLLALGAGGRLEEHAAPGPVLLSVMEGRVNFSTPEESVEAGPGGLVYCAAGVRHAVEALAESVCVVTISTRPG